jgi:hypothetical protein
VVYGAGDVPQFKATDDAQRSQRREVGKPIQVRDVWLGVYIDLHVWTRPEKLGNQPDFWQHVAMQRNGGLVRFERAQLVGA